MRHRFGETATALLDERPDVVVVLADIGTARLAETGAAERHSTRLINVGIREQAMVAVAAGFALEGFRPIVHSYAPFLVERPFEQLKLDLGHQGVGAVLVSIGATFDASTEGRTHQSTGDVAMVSSLPGWRVHVPGHPDEVEPLLRAAVEGTGSEYIRLSAASNRKPMARRPGEVIPVRHGSTGAPVVLAVGPMLDVVLAATAARDVTVAYVATVHPLDRRAVRALASSATEIVVVEPYLAGTSAAGIAAALWDKPHRLLCVGAPAAELRRYGTREQLEADAGLDAAGIAAQLAGFLDLVQAA
ncbi:MAG TPA: transketolase C-terminal domain-containing protein [Acidimicrobiia bacterium]